MIVRGAHLFLALACPLSRSVSFRRAPETESLDLAISI
jgi:hypothetical protein